MPSSNVNNNRITVAVKTNVVRSDVDVIRVSAKALARGLDGTDGANGVGVPTGGTAGQVLAKIDSTNFNTEWVNQSGGGGSVTSVNAQTGVVVLDTDDIADTSTNRYTNDSDITRLLNTSGTNTGDQDLSSYATTSALASGLATKEPTITSGTTAQYWRGDKSWQTLDKTAVGLANVDNTSDTTKNAAAVSLTNKNLTSGTNTFPTFNQNTTGSAATLTTARTIGIATGDVTSAGSTFNGSANNTNAYTLATVNSNVGSFTYASITVNGKGLITAASNGATPEVPLTFSTGLTRSTNTVTVNTSQNISTLSNLTSNGAVMTSGGTGALSVVTNTGTGNNVLATSPTLVTPALGTPSALTLTNATGLPVTGISATGTPSSVTYLRGDGAWVTPAGGGGTGTVTDFIFTNANGISGSVLTSNTTPTLSLSLGAITPTSVNSVVLSGSSTPTLAVTGASTVSGTNTGDQTTVSGNAGTATALQTARLINGVSFNGTANIDTPSTAVQRSVSQTAHGFVVGDIVRQTTTANTYVKSQADSGANAGVSGIVIGPVTTNAFVLLTEGPITGLSGLTAGTQYYLSPTTAGAYTATEPSTVGQVSKPVFIADSTTSGIFHNYRGITIASVGAGDMILAANQTVTGNKTFNNNTLILAGGTSGVTTLQATAVSTSGTVILPTSGNLYGTLAGSITSSQLATSLSDETGSGSAVFATSPALVTPTLGVATATTINKVTITAPTTNATLTLVQGSSLITAGAFATTLTSTATTNATLPAGTNTLYSTLSGSITSAQLATSLTDETGTGSAVFGTSPTLTTPVVSQFGTTSGLGAAWGTWSPTITAGAGTITSSSVSDARFKQIGKTIHYVVNITVITAGTGAGNLLFTLPATAQISAGHIGGGREDALTGNALTVKLNSTTQGAVATYNNGTPIANGSVSRISGTYEAA